MGYSELANRLGKEMANGTQYVIEHNTVSGVPMLTETSVKQHLATLELDLAQELQAVENANIQAIGETFSVRCLRKAVSELRKATYHAELALSSALNDQKVGK